MPPTVVASSSAAAASNGARASGGNFEFVVVARSYARRTKWGEYSVAVVAAAAGGGEPGSKMTDLAAVEIVVVVEPVAVVADAERSQPLSSAAAVAIAALDLAVVAMLASGR